MQQPRIEPGQHVLYTDLINETHNAIITAVWTDAEIVSEEGISGISLAYVGASEYTDHQLMEVARVPHLSKYGRTVAGDYLSGQTFYWRRPPMAGGELMAEMAKHGGEALADLADGPVTNEVVRDLLLLHAMDVPLEVIAHWDPTQREDAAQWAGALHAKASDNDDIEVPPFPVFLTPYKHSADPLPLMQRMAAEIPDSTKPPVQTKSKKRARNRRGR